MNPSCSHFKFNVVNQIFIDQPSSEPKVKVIIPMYEPLEVVECEKRGKTIAEPEELIRITKSNIINS